MKEADEKTLSLYTLDPPEWRAQLIANKEPRLYPDFFPGATALYPQSTTQTGSHVPGMSRDGSAANAGAGGNQHVPIPGVTASKEDELSEHAVKLGFVNKAVVQTENFSAHALIHNKLNNGPSINALGKIIQKVIERQVRDESLTPAVGPWTYKPPSKVVYNASRLENWYTELANPAVPLSKLARTIPSVPSSSQGMTSTGTGTYGGASTPSATAPVHVKSTDRNLDMLINRQVPLDRAIWFLQAVGQNEVSQLSKSKNLQLHPSLAYSVEFTTSLVDALRRQIAEALQPLAQFGQASAAGRLLPGMSVKGRPRNILAEDQAKERWLAKWEYSVHLLTSCLEERMLDKHRLCILFLQNLQANYSLQVLWWLAIILQTVLEDILDTAWMCKSFILSVFTWVETMTRKTLEGPNADTEFKNVGASLLQLCWRTDTSMFLLPEILNNSEKKALLKSLVHSDTANKKPDNTDTDDSWEDLSHRYDILSCKIEPDARSYSLEDHSYSELDADAMSPWTQSRPTGHTTWTINSEKALQILDAWTGYENIESLTARYFAVASSQHSDVHSVSQAANSAGNVAQCDNQNFAETVKLLLIWATTNARTGDHRPLLAVAMLKAETLSNQAIAGNSARSTTPDEELLVSKNLRKTLLQWLDAQDSALLSTDSTAPKWLCEFLVQQLCQLLLDAGLLQVSDLLQKIIARGGHTRESTGRGLCEQILRQFAGRPDKPALNWQMGYVGMERRGTGATFSQGSSTNELTNDISPDLEQCMLCIRQGTCQDGKPRDDTCQHLRILERRLLAIDIVDRMTLVAHQLHPRLRQSLEQSQGSPMDDSIALGLLSLLYNISAQSVYVDTAIEVLRKRENGQNTILACLASARADRRLWMAMQRMHDIVEAAFLAVSGRSQVDHLDVRILQDLASFGTQGFLTATQMRDLRQCVKRGQTQHAYTLPLVEIPSPPPTDDVGNSLTASVGETLAEFLYTLPSDSNHAIELASKKLVALPLDAISCEKVILPAILKTITEAQLQETKHLQELWRRLLRTRGGRAYLPSVAKDVLQAYPVTAFSDAACVFVKELIANRLLSIDSALRILAIPFLQGLAHLQDIDTEAVQACVTLLSDLLVEGTRRSATEYEIAASRSTIYDGSSFIDLISQVRAIFASQQELANLSLTPATTKAAASIMTFVRQLLHSREFRLAWTCQAEMRSRQLLPTGETNPKRIEEKMGSSMAAELLILILKDIIQDLLSTDGHVDWDRSDIEYAAPLLNAGLFGTYITNIRNMYFRALPYATSTLSSKSSHVQTSQNSYRFAKQSLRHMFSGERAEAEQQIALFATNNAETFIIVAFEALENDLSIWLRGNGDLPPSHKHLSDMLDTRILQCLDVLTWLTGLLDGRRPALVMQVLLEKVAVHAVSMLHRICDKVIGVSRAVLANSMESLGRLLCLLVIWAEPSPAMIGDWTRCMISIVRYSLSCDTSIGFLSDVVGHTLHILGSNAGQARLSILRALSDDPNSRIEPLRNSLWKLIGLGPSESFDQLEYDNRQYFALQNAWSGVAVEIPTASSLHDLLGANTMAINLQKYRPRIKSFPRQLQTTALQTVASGWQSFDSENPCDQETAFQRDFRRALTAQTEPSSLHPSQQVSRSRAASAQVLTATGNKSDNLAKSSVKTAQSKPPDGNPANGANKKRKTGPEHPVPEELSPKKKAKANASVGGKYPKKK